MAVNEENAAGGRVVTAPTNGAAGIIPSVLTYYRNFHEGASNDKVVGFSSHRRSELEFYIKPVRLFLVQKWVCQGEVGVACSRQPVHSRPYSLEH